MTLRADVSTPIRPPLVSAHDGVRRVTAGPVSARSEERLDGADGLLRRLVRIQSSISSRSPLQDVMSAITAGAVDLFGSGTSSLRLRDPATGRLFTAMRDERETRACEGVDPISLTASVRSGSEEIGELTVTTPITPGFVETAREMLEVLAEHAGIALRGAGTREDVLAALSDDLTGLPRRRLFLQRLDAALQWCAKIDLPVAVFFADLDGFKAINDSLGHTAGDAMLRSTTGRLVGVWPEVDNWGRIGGDEFVLFIEGCDRVRAGEIAAQIAASLRQPMVLSGRATYTSASVGYTVVEGGGTAESAVRQADIAMYEGKRTGRDSVTAFHPDMERRVVVRSELESQLRRTLIGAGPRVVYQPIVDLRSGATIAVEALARWHSPTQGPISPDRFVAMAEQMGVIEQLDEHVLRTACRTLVGRRDPVSGRLLGVSVNLSTMHLASIDCADRIGAILDETGFAPRRLILEVTESIAIEDDELIGEQLHRLRAMGIRIAIDDFGTGHSSLAQLENLPVDIVKVDRSFLARVPESERRLRYVESIVAMVNALDMRVVFEGIENDRQVRALASLGVHLGQGYLLAEPTGEAELAAQLAAAVDAVRATTDPTLL